MPIRSRKVIFVPFCVLCQGAKARGLARTHRAIVSEIVYMLVESDVNIVQLPCPEMLGEGLEREPRDASYYERADFMETCRVLARSQADIIESFTRAGFHVVALLGIERSPSCSLSHVRRNGMVVRGRGVFMSGLMDELECRGIFPQTISLDIGKMEEALGRLSESPSSAGASRGP